MGECHATYSACNSIHRLMLSTCFLLTRRKLKSASKQNLRANESRVKLAETIPSDRKIDNKVKCRSMVGTLRAVSPVRRWGNCGNVRIVYRSRTLHAASLPSFCTPLICFLLISSLLISSPLICFLLISSPLICFLLICFLLISSPLICFLLICSPLICSLLIRFLLICSPLISFLLIRSLLICSFAYLYI